MIPNPFSRASAAVSGAPVTRAAFHLTRADVFNRLYLVVMFATIVAIGALGMFALEASKTSGDVVEHTFEQVKFATEMGSALDEEYTELLSQIQQNRGKMSTTFVGSTHAFETVHAASRRDPSASNAPVLKTLMPLHAEFVSESRAISAALAAGNRERAIRIEVERAAPNVRAIRLALDAMSAIAFRSSAAEDSKDVRLSGMLERLIVSVTVLGVALMAGFALLLGLYKRSADQSAAATLAALEKAARTDNLTNLGNNRSFYDDFEREVSRAKRHDLPLVLALIDIDDFKAVNDKAGHAHGDAVLALVGERLLSMRQEDRAYRIGGDEFALLLVETEPDEACAALGRLQAEIQDAGMGATVSIGYVNLAGERLDAESYELADAALYEAKRLGRNQTVCFAQISGSVSVFSARKAYAVRTMIAQGLVDTAFQPIWDMQSTRPLGFEALARPFAELGLSGPQEAFDIAQRIRQLPELDMLCARKALESSVNLPAGSTIFLNYSPASLANASFDPHAFIARVRAAGLHPEQIVIELTERRIDDPALVAQQISALRALGVRLALDDTGSGHAGLEILRKVRFDFVKIDRLLIVDAMENAEARGVLAGIIAIAREGRSYLIAEGIESGKMLDFIGDVHLSKSGQFSGVRGIQGYLLGRPHVGAADFRALERHHDFLAARRLEKRSTPGLVDAVSGEEADGSGWRPSIVPASYKHDTPAA